MVAPSDPGTLVRSLVRVPGSGSDSSAGSVCCDLARASTLAASVPVNPTLPADLRRKRPSQQSTASNSLQNQPSEMKEVTGTVLVAKRVVKANVKISPPVTVTRTNTTSCKRPYSEESANTRMTRPANSNSSGQGETQENFQAKRARIVYMTPQQVAEHAKNIIQGPLPPGTISVHVPQTNNTPIMNPATIAQLLQEWNTLRQENQVLQQKLSLFHQLFRNKKKLTSVVKQLGINVVRSCAE